MVDDHEHLTAKRVHYVGPAIKDVVVESADWDGGSTQRISWRYDGAVPQVAVQLVKPEESELFGWRSVGNFLGFLVDNTGSYTAQVPIGVTPGSYRVRVTSTAAADVSAVSALLRIDRGATMPAIKDVVVESADWDGGSTQRISWRYDGAVPQVAVQLVKPEKSELFGWRSVGDFLGSLIDNTGSYTVHVPVGMAPGSYRVCIKSTAAADVSAVSALLRIDSGATMPAIKDVVVESADWDGGSTQRISWRYDGAVPKVRIELIASARDKDMFIMPHVVDILDRCVDNTGSYAANVPIGMSPGNYRVRVTSAAAADASAISEPLRIDPDKMPPAIKDVTVQYSICHGGSAQRVSWRHDGAVPSVRVDLVAPEANTYGRRHIADTLGFLVDNTGSYTAQVPIGMTPGFYRVRVTSTAAADVSAISKPIRLDEARRAHCVTVATLLLGLPPSQRLPYPLIRSIAILSAP